MSSAKSSFAGPPARPSPRAQKTRTAPGSEWQEDGDDWSERDGASSSDSDWPGESWEAVEAKALRALDERLDALCGQPGASSSAADATNSPAAAPPWRHTAPGTLPSAASLAAASLEAQGCREEAARMVEALASEPYNPEDHVLTVDEMWGGLSDGGASSAAADVVDGASAKGTVTMEQSPTPAARSDAQPSVASIAATSLEAHGCQEEAARMAEVLASDPYNPEDHMLTADEMWGGLSDKEEDAVDEAAQAAAAQPSTATADMPRQAAPATQARDAWPDVGPAALEVAAQAAPESGDALRLRRLLAGQENAADVLSGLDFSELSDLADDCSRAAETLQWVMKRQRDLLKAASKGMSGPPV